MNTTINWKAATDAEKNAYFAEWVAGWRAVKEKRGEFTLCVALDANDPDPWRHWNPKEVEQRKSRYTATTCQEAVKIGFFGRTFPDYLHSADAVLPWLEKFPLLIERSMFGGDEFLWDVRIEVNGCWFFGRAKFLSEAAMIALPRAKGCQIIT